MRYGTFETTTTYPTRNRAISSGVIDSETDELFMTLDLDSAQRLADLLNRGTDCRFNCRAKREADYLQGWKDRDVSCQIVESGKRCAKRYVAGAKNGLSSPHDLRHV